MYGKVRKVLELMMPLIENIVEFQEVCTVSYVPDLRQNSIKRVI